MLSNWRSPPRPARNRRSKVGRITGKTGKSAEVERVAAGSAVAMKRSNVRGAKGPCHLQRLQHREGKDEMTKASIDLQDLRRRIYVKASAAYEIAKQNGPGQIHQPRPELSEGDDHGRLLRRLLAAPASDFAIIADCCVRTLIWVNGRDCALTLAASTRAPSAAPRRSDLASC